MKKFIFVICGLFMLNNATFGQDALEKDLRKSFRKFELVKLDNNALREKARTRQPIEIQAHGRLFEFVLKPNDLRAANYRAAESTDAGERQMEKQIEVTTYKGKLSDDAGSEVR